MHIGGEQSVIGVGGVVVVVVKVDDGMSDGQVDASIWSRLGCGRTQQDDTYRDNIHNMFKHSVARTVHIRHNCLSST